MKQESPTFTPMEGVSPSESPLFMKGESPTSIQIEYPASIPQKSTVTTASPLADGRTESEFDKTQKVDQPRLPWRWSSSGTKTRELYKPTVVGKWWYAWAQEHPECTSVISNVGRIMETELGIELFGDEKCIRCRRDGLECCEYIDKARTQVNNVGTACARCRAEPSNRGCGLGNSRRGPRKKKCPPDPGPRFLLPKLAHQYPYGYPYGAAV